MVVAGSYLAQPQAAAGVQGCFQQVVYSLTPLQLDHLVLDCFHSKAILSLWLGHPGSAGGLLDLDADECLVGGDWVVRC